MKVFAGLYLDEDVSALVAVLLRVRGFDVIATRHVGMLGLDDDAGLAHAIEQGRCVVTHNRVHFERIHRRHVTMGQEHYGINIAARRSPQEIARRPATLLNSLSADEFSNQLLHV